MRVLKGTLTFVLGIIMGIVLFVGAIAGTIYAVATSFTIGDITQKVGLTGDKAIFDEGSVHRSAGPGLHLLCASAVLW